eukprot:TRINITY_DN4794_c0_g1_i1.p1 TRINITY_DN4794_c0_g1~~TRINITY_DN4794_c0_g1_i1.p1  ORF type:complete len:366 (-),score=76.10 TRINITY_DN4794_c0_g1_i1:90-1121(-)
MQKPSFLSLVDLASVRAGGEVLYASDEWFAPAENLLKEGRGVWIEGKYTENGKWMDGWETARHGKLKRGGRDVCIIKLGFAGVIAGVDIDTLHFTGNYAQHASIEAACIESDLPWFMIHQDDSIWHEILPKSELVGGTPDAGHNYFSINSPQRWTHLRFSIYPDGGVSRLRVYGLGSINWDKVRESNELIDLASVRCGAKIVACSNDYFSQPINLLMPGRAADMGDGWESRRSREDGHFDWVIIQLGSRGHFKAIEVDTKWFKGNYPHEFSLQGCNVSMDDLKDQSIPEEAWRDIVPRRPGAGHSRMVFFASDLGCDPLITHIRLNSFPDGGVSRIRVFGHAA